MQGPVRRLSYLAPASLLVALFAVSCILDLSGPSSRVGYFALAPTFPAAAAAIVDVDSVHVELRRTSDSTVALDTAFAVTPSDSIDLSLTVVLAELGETFWLELECFDPTGNLVFAAGPLEVTATTSAGDVEAQDIDVEYVGVGANAMDVRIVSAEVSVRFGETVTLEAEALDDSGDPIPGTPIKWISHDTDRLTVIDSKVGQIMAGYLRGPAAIEAQLLTDLADTITVDVLAVPNSITVVSGNDQTALIGGILADPVVIQVDAADGSMQDVAVDFETSDDGSFDPTSASTDAAGRAATVWTLGSAAGIQTGTATAIDWPGVTGSFRATAVTPQTTRLSFTVQPSDVAPGAIVTPAVEVTALNEFGVVDVEYTGDITIAIANNPADGTLSGTTTVSPTLGVAQFSDLSIDLAGAGYTLSATASELEPATSMPFSVGSFQAATVSWTNAAGGNWSNPSNWDAGRVPTAIDTVDITLEGDYNVTLDQSAAVQILRVGGTSGLQAFRIDTTTLTVSELLNVGPTGELLLNNDIGGNGGIDILGRMQWTGGTISTVGPLTIGSTGVLEINASNFVTLNGPDLRNDGTVDWFAGGISLEDGNIENNTNGTFNAYAEANISAYGTVHNYGFFEKEGADSTRVSVPFYNYDPGVINIGSGWLLLSGDFSHADQAVLEGVGTLNISSANVQSFQGYVRPGDLGDATGILTIEGSLALGSGANVELTINGTTQGQEYDALVVEGDLSLGGQLNINAGGYTPTLDDVFNVLFFDSRTGDFSSITGLDVGGGITLEPQWNASSLDLVATSDQPGGTVAWLPNFVDTDWHNPANWDLGRVPTATDTARIAVDVDVTVGVAADVTVARLEVGRSANVNTQAVAVTQGGRLRIDSSATVEASGLLIISEGTLEGAATITIAGGMVWTGGELAGTGTLLINPGVTLAIDGSSFTIDGFTIDNRGSAAWMSGSLTGLNDPQFLNNAAATFEMVSDGTWGGSGSFQNDGTFRYTGTTIGTFGWALTNAGTLDAVGPNGILRLTGDFTHEDGAIIQGSGTFDLTTTPVLGWDGDVNPGGTGATGILNFLGSGSPSPLFTANVEIGGTTAGTEYDQATVSQTLTVNGRLNVDLINGFEPQLGQTFTILTFGDRIGEFSDTTGLAIPGNLAFDLVWNTTSLDLVVVDASPVSPADVIFFSDSGGGLDYGVFTNSADGSSLAEVASTGSPLQFLISPRWSMDRQRIAFTNDASGTSNLYMATSTGAELTVLVNNIASGYPRWSHNGQHLGFICRPAVAGVDHVCVIPNVTGPIGDIPLNSHVMPTSAMPAEWQTGSPAADWDPRPASQDRFLFARDSGVVAVSRFFSMNYDGTGLDTITTDLLQVDGGPLQAQEMDVSTDGSMIVFVGFDTQSFTERLYVVNTDGTGLRRLTFPTGTVYDERPLFSPDGSEILFGRRDDFCNLTYWIVGINNTDGSLERQITGDVLSCEMDPYDQVGMDWSPNGDRITLVGIDETYNWWRVYVVPSTVTPVNYLQVRVPIGRDADAVSWLFEGQPNWRP